MDIVAQIMSDKAAGTRRLVAEYGDRLFKAAFRLCGNETDAEDYIFRTLERAVERIDRFSGRSSFFTWLYEILVNIIRTDARRKAANALVFSSKLPETEDIRPNVGVALSLKEEAEMLRAVIGELPLPLKEMVVLRYYEDMTVPEIAKVTAIPEGTVKSRLHVAKNQIRTRIMRTIHQDRSSNI